MKHRVCEALLNVAGASPLFRLTGLPELDGSLAGLTKYRDLALLTAADRQRRRLVGKPA